MIISQQKRKENILEYLIYMFQVEDMIRACQLDIEKVQEQIISQYQENYETRRNIREWYKALITMMNENENQQTGHIPILNTLIKDMEDIHASLLSKKDKKEYQSLYSEIKPAIEELKLKSGDPGIQEIEACLNGLYGYLLLKISSKKINPETENAINGISSMLNLLSVEFHKFETGDSEL